MKKIKGKIQCKNTGRNLYFPEIIWFDENAEMQIQTFGSESEGFFEIDVPTETTTLYIRNKGYKSKDITLPPNTSTIYLLIELEKNTKYN